MLILSYVTNFQTVPHRAGIYNGRMRPRRTPGERSTPQGSHVPVLLKEVLEALHPGPGEIVVDCTLGKAGHACEILKRLGLSGLLLGFDLDTDNLQQARSLLEKVGHPFDIIHGNYAGLVQALAERSKAGVHGLIADLGMSSMQVDDSERGFSFVRDGPLDMRMDRTRGKTAAETLQTISETDLVTLLTELGDEPDAAVIASGIVRHREQEPIIRTRQLSDLIGQLVRKPSERGKGWVLSPKRGKFTIHPAARTFQALRIHVNRELANLKNLLRVLPEVLLPGGRAAIISFHSGEDRLVKSAFKDGLRSGVYSRISEDPVRASFEEVGRNPRSRSAKLRWAVKN